MSRLALLAVLALGGCADLDAPFTCTKDADCLSHEGDGVCQAATHACSFVDSACAGGQRYGKLEGAALAGMCVDGSGAVAHLAGEQVGGTGNLDLGLLVGEMGSASLTIDTTTLLINGKPPASGQVFEVDHEATSGAELAVLRVGSVEVPFGVTLHVTGARGFVVVASGDVSVGGVIDASAHGVVPGPGGGAPGTGIGVGAVGSDPVGSSGAGYGTVGGAGNPGGDNQVASTAPALPGGATYGDAPVTVLFGGSGGGAGSGSPGGAGGGIVQITSATSVEINAPGGINVGGGGAPADASSEHAVAAGGGSGGTIYLQAPSVKVSGTLAANGGGGGASSQAMAAEDGQLTASPATGGGGTWDGGGAGGAKAAAPGEGVYCSCQDEPEGGGGGGAVGRIAILYSTSYGAFGVSSPTESATKR